MGEVPVERFQPTSGRVTGILGLLMAAVIVVVGLVGLVGRENAPSLSVVAFATVAGTLIWSAMLRPRVWVTAEALVMRNVLHTVWIPLAAIEQVAVGQVLAVSAGERRFVSPAVGRSWRQVARDRRRARNEAETPEAPTYADYVEERIGRLAKEARTSAGVPPRSEEQRALASGVRRAWAWPEVVTLAVATLVFVVSLGL